MEVLLSFQKLSNFDMLESQPSEHRRHRRSCIFCGRIQNSIAQRSCCNCACAFFSTCDSKFGSAFTSNPVSRAYTRVLFTSIVVRNTCEGGSDRRIDRPASLP